MLKAILLLLCALLPVNAVNAAETKKGLMLVDLTDEFAATWDRTRTLPDAGRVAAVKEGMEPLIPGFYSHKRLNLPTSERYDRNVLAALKRYPEERAQIAEVSRRFSALLAPAQESFEAEFGPMTGYPPIYLVHSLGEFDGGTRDLPGGGVLMFGADMIARLHLQHDISPFFHHELFHLYHVRSFENCDAVWCGLWTEGLATYVAASLNPGATDAELLLDFPAPIRPVVDKNRVAAVCAVVRRLDSTDQKDAVALFSTDRLAPDLPPRFGYYVGYLAAAEMAKEHDLNTLATMKREDVRPRLEAALHRLATCKS